MKYWLWLEKAGVDTFSIDEQNENLIWLEPGGLVKLGQYLGRSWSRLAVAAKYGGYEFREVGRWQTGNLA